MVDVGKIFNLTLEQARNDLIGRKGLSLGHIYAFKPDGSMGIFALDPSIFEPGAVKAGFARRLRQALLDGGYEAYGFCAEAWVSTRTADDGKGNILPEDDPDRDEVLQVIVGTRERGYCRYSTMHRRPNGTVRRLSERPYDPDEHGGRFGHLLTPQPWSGTPRYAGLDNQVLRH
jgi:hypothetical protein